tara:strand:- start:1256 stop:1465 length:210 start_codon:yes stop_codon:yes gene_type:complete
MEYADIIKLFAYFYLTILISFIFLYLKSMYDQYKNAHDKWYDINRDYKKIDKEIYNTYDDPSLLINQLD